MGSQGVVAKHKDGLYKGGMRTRTWLKMLEDEDPDLQPNETAGGTVRPLAELL
jgi:ATP-dependent DNA ligase